MFKDKVIVITNSSSGIGRSLALTMASEGARAGQFFITVHADTAGRFRDKAADPGACVDLLVQFRDHALALREAARTQR
jgi:NAD(P)-dependent dehydrogenase (short-subunit alcohol dehydrogenase family)